MVQVEPCCVRFSRTDACGIVRARCREGRRLGRVGRFCE